MNLKTYYMDRSIDYQEILCRDDMIQKYYLIRNPKHVVYVTIPDGCVDIQFMFQGSGKKACISGSPSEPHISPYVDQDWIFGIKLNPGVLPIAMSRDEIGIPECYIDITAQEGIMDILYALEIAASVSGPVPEKVQKILSGSAPEKVPEILPEPAPEKELEILSGSAIETISKPAAESVPNTVSKPMPIPAATSRPENGVLPDMIALTTNCVKKMICGCDNPVVSSALYEILHQEGCVKMAQIADNMKYSQHYINREFKKNTGFSLKQYSEIIRLQNAITYLEKENVDFVYDKLGYYDQAHFIKEFKKFTLLTPQNYIRAKIQRTFV